MSKKVVVTFDSVEDFWRFIWNPGRLRIGQIKVRETKAKKKRQRSSAKKSSRG